MKKEGEVKFNDDVTAAITTRESEYKQQLERTQKEVEELKRKYLY